MQSASNPIKKLVDLARASVCGCAGACAASCVYAGCRRACRRGGVHAVARLVAHVAWCRAWRWSVCCGDVVPSSQSGARTFFLVPSLICIVCTHSTVHRHVQHIQAAQEGPCGASVCLTRLSVVHSLVWLAQLIPLFAIIGGGVVMAGLYTLRLAVKSHDVVCGSLVFYCARM